MHMKKKIFIILIILIFLLVIFGTVLIVIDKRNSSVSLMKENVIIEYGNTYIPKTEELIDLTKYNFIDSKDIRIETNIENEKDKEYPAVGEYEINVYYKDKILKQKIEVIDKTAPELSIQDNIEIEYNTDLSKFDFKKYITTTDLSEIKDYVIDLSKINSSESGEYETVISIEDIYGNKTEKSFKIKILEKIEEKDEKKVVTTSSQTNQSNSSKNESSNKKVTTNSNSTSNTKSTTNSSSTNKAQNTTNSKNTTEEKTNNSKKEDTKETPRCSHSNENYYNSQEEAVATYKSKSKELSDKVENGEITYEEYVKVCPYRIRNMDMH